jgi:hypothetical protein
VSSQVLLVFAALLVLQVKHFVADFVLQTPYQFLNKGIYGHPGGLIHSGIHVVGTVFAFLVIAPSWPIAAAILAGEFIAHYHIDWLKEGTVKRQQWQFPQAEFWWTFGADQALHQVTYLVIVAVLVTQIVS